jgi:hypothetical protein
MSDAMGERKVHCPEQGDDCWSADCTIKICVLRQQRIISEQRIADWEAHFRTNPVNREVVALKVVRDLITEHNTLIAANKPGLLKNFNGNIIDTRLPLPERGRTGSKKYRECQRLVAQVLGSTKPRIVERFRNEMDSVVRQRAPWKYLGSVNHDWPE